MEPHFLLPSGTQRIARITLEAEIPSSDAVAMLGVLFLGSAKGFPCGDGGPQDPGNISLLDWQPDGVVDISDAVAMLTFQFLGGRPHALASEVDAEGCIRIVGCTDLCGQ